MVVAINTTCFGRDEQKNHVLVAELLRHATNCVAWAGLRWPKRASEWDKKGPESRRQPGWGSKTRRTILYRRRILTTTSRSRDSRRLIQAPAYPRARTRQQWQISC
jgi:hypothetical protein